MYDNASSQIGWVDSSLQILCFNFFAIAKRSVQANNKARYTSMYGVTSLIATAILLPLLGFVTVCVRFYVRLRLKPTYLGVDDWLIAFSCLLTVAQGADQIIGMKLNQSLLKGHVNYASL